MNMSDEAKQVVFEQTLRAFCEKHPIINVEIDAASICVLIAQLQLALRHPSNCGYGSQIASAFCHSLLHTIEAEGGGTLADLLREGFDPSKDVEVT